MKSGFQKGEFMDLKEAKNIENRIDLVPISQDDMYGIETCNQNDNKEENRISEKEMLDYLLSTGLYKNGTEKHPYKDLYYEQQMLNSDKTVPIKDLAERFIKIDKAFNGRSWNIQQILANISMIVPVEDRR